MMKYVAILFTLFILVQSQRPPYAGSSKPYPAVLPQYLEEQAAAAAAAAPEASGVAPGASGVAAAAPSSNSTQTVLTRIDANDTNPEVTVTSTIPPDLPVDALGDIDLINRIKTWPREKQPFWYINWQKIQEHRGDTANQQQIQAQQNTRSFFAG